MRSARWCFVALLCAGSAGCERSAAQRHCRLGPEHTVALSAAKDFDGIALVASGPGAIAFWSEPSGLYAQRLSALGSVEGARARIGARCEGGLDALARPDDGGVDLACLLQPTRGKHEEAGGLLRLALSRQLKPSARALLGSAGALSEGVALARTAAGLELVWHDGAADSQGVWWLALAGDDAPRGAPLQLSEPGRVASAPSLALAPDGSSMATWAETWVEGEGLHSRIVEWTRAAGTRTLHQVGNYAAMPKLIAHNGRLVLAFRDHREGEKTGLYVAPLGATGLLNAPVRVGRADGTGRPALVACMGGLVSATPRTYGGDYFIGINWLDAQLERSRGEQQFYEDSHAFTHVAASCQGGHALLFIGEFPQLTRPTAALRAVSYTCP
ncbi:MAG TPA: hypothetical protein VK509_18885 [Polyangiales bacterium]|nr:hypothetical protein [Polyangiales bacterium]